MGKRITLTDDDIILFIKLLEDISTGVGTARLITVQRIISIKKKLGYGEMQS